ncbi:hypothetical protein BaRGS_00003534 [Batillaria attramentaria]|uniref:Apple domain-containing protein n=1 Tax=Batillaria attramentaria TaxID=370345 RepID=A0ABD0M188_9CAEN
MNTFCVGVVFLHVTIVTLQAAVEVTTTCKSKRVASFKDKLSTSWLVSQQNVKGVRQCAVLCLSDVRCVSFVYSGVINDCRLFAVVKTTSDMTTSTPGYQYYDTCKGVGYYGAACSSDPDCSLPQTRCFQSVCRCQPGYSFDPYQAACVATCATYGPEFEAVPDHFINANNEESLMDYDTQMCLDRCRQATTYLCRSADVRISPDPACSTASVTKLDVPAADWLPGNTWVTVHYQRHCAL